MNVRVINVIDEDFVNYKCASMTIGFPFCSFKCGWKICQNRKFIDAPMIKIDSNDLVKRYIQNPITEAIVFQGLEPFDSPEIFDLIMEFRSQTNDVIIIYTGYTRDEIIDRGYLKKLQSFQNIVVKYGRFVPEHESHFDEVLGVYLASDNQYAVKES